MSLSGCLKAVGGGKLTGAIHGGSITTGFQLRCEDVGTSAGHVTGQFQYQDHGTNVAFHVDIDQLLPTTCEALDQILAGAGIPGTFSTLGTYTPQPQTVGIGGQVQVTIQSGPNAVSLAGCDPGIDALAVQVRSGFYASYAEQGCLEKGNFTVFTE
jgi:hypothetical protein